MIDLLPSLIEMFGTISSITVAFLVLLHESFSKKVSEAEESVVYDVRNYLHCSHLKKYEHLNFELSPKDELYEDVYKIAEFDVVNDIKTVEKLIKHFKLIIRQCDTKIANKKRDENITDVSVLRTHIQNEHLSYVEKSLSDFKNVKEKYSKIPNLILWYMGFPIGITLLLIIIHWAKPLYEPDYAGMTEIAIFVITLLGLGFIIFASSRLYNYHQTPNKSH